MPPRFTAFAVLTLLLAPAAAGDVPTLDERLLEGIVDPDDPAATQVPSEPVDVPVGEPRNAPCPNPSTLVILRGTEDNFAGTEPASPRPELVAFLNGRASRAYDESGANLHFIDTISPLPDRIFRATLSLRVNVAGLLSSNDRLNVAYVPGNTPPFLFTQAIGSTGSGTYSYLLSKEVVLHMNANGYLDIHVQDDTTIDYVKLELVHCGCVESDPFVVLQGGQDDFRGPEPTTPRPEVAARVAGPTRRYDDPGPFRTFATTVPVPHDIIAATVEIRFRGEGRLTVGEHLRLVLGPVDWEATYPIDTGSAPVVRRYDLKALGLLEEVKNASGVDVLVAKNTEVDYVRVEGRVCVCRDPGPRELVAGDMDEFEGGDGMDDVTTPTGAFGQWLPHPRRGFDDPTSDKRFGHTFHMGCGMIRDAILEVRVRPRPGGAATDSIALQYTGGTPIFLWSDSFTNLAGVPWSTAGPMTLQLQLGTMPRMIPLMNGQHKLDVYIQDDTDVDHMRLILFR